MLKPSRIICPAVTAFLVIGAFFWVQGGERPAVTSSSSVVLAMQGSASTSADHSPRGPLSNVGWIGVMIEENQGHGVRVTGVFPGGPAAMAGVRVGNRPETLPGKAARP
jgi:predicted metalloprotease with PDZ domain